MTPILKRLPPPSPFGKARRRIFPVAVSLIIGSIAAIQSTVAETRGPLALPKSAMSIATTSSASIVSEIPFSAFVQLSSCNSNNTTCFTALPPVPAQEQWALQFVSCTVDTAAAATFRDFSVQISDKSVTKLLGFHFVAPTYQSNRQNGVAVYVASQSLVLTARSGSIVHLVANSIGNMGGGRCALSGVKQKLG